MIDLVVDRREMRNTISPHAGFYDEGPQGCLKFMTETLSKLYEQGLTKLRSEVESYPSEADFGKPAAIFRTQPVISRFT